MRLRAEARVGLIVLIALIALGGIIVFLSGFGLGGGTYTVCAIFGDVLRLADGAEVRMAGVRVGMVESISLTPDKRARVDMRIAQKFKGAIPSDSTARITTGGVAGVGDFYVEIIPGSSKTPIKVGQCIRSQQLPKLDDLMAQVGQIVSGLKTSVGSVNEILTNPKTRQSLEDIIENVRESTAQTAAVTQEVHRLVSNNSPEFERLIAKVGDAADDFAAVSQDFRSALENGGTRDIQQTLENANKTAQNLEASTAQLRKLAEDQELQMQLRETIESAHEAAQGAAEIVGRVQSIIGPKKRGPSTPVPGQGSRVDAFVVTEDGPFRLDYNLTIPGNGRKFYRLGLFDIGEGTYLNAQIGKVLDPQSAVRYGLYASRIAVGYDRKFSDNASLQLDFYRPNDPKLEAKLRYDFAPNWGAWLGTEDVFGDGGGLIGLQYHR